MRVIVIILVFACVLAAQTATSSGSGWSQAGSLKQADVALIGDLIAGSAVDNVNRVQVRATVRAVRVLKGNVLAGADLPVAWDYMPPAAASPQVTTRVEKVHALWLLERNGDGYKALPVSRATLAVGGAFQPVPDVRLSGEFFYSADASFDVKLASELGAVLEAIATTEGDKLNPQRVLSPAGPVSTWRTGPAQPHFNSMVSLLAVTDSAASLPAYQRFVSSPYANLRAVGLAGLLRAGSTEAIFALERDLAVLAPTQEATQFSRGLPHIDVSRDAAAMHALGRVALNEIALPLFEGDAASRLGSSKNVEALPYLRVMLESPDPYTRARAMAAFCDALRPVPKQKSALDALWKPEYSLYCPNRAPMSDNAAETADLNFWKGWWESQRPELEKLAGKPLREPATPGRYRALADPRAPASVAVSLDTRFQTLVSRYSAFQRMPRAPGTLLPEVRMSKEDDDKLKQILAQVSAQLDAQREKMQQLINQYRIRGQRPEAEVMRKTEEERVGILHAGVQRAQQELSAEGWQAVEKHLNAMNIQGFRLPSPTP